MKGINEMTEQEFLEFEMIGSNFDDDWLCEHNRKFTEDCAECDESFKVQLDGEIIEPEPDKCDHGIDMFGPGYGKCSECDKVCYNTVTMSDASCHRKADGKNWKYASATNEWVPVSTSLAGTGYSTGTWSVGKSCKHFMDEFMLDDEHAIYPSAERNVPYNDKRKKEDYPDLGVYLYSGWVSDYHSKFTASPGLDVPWTNGTATREPEWPMAYIDWPDYGVPKDFDTVLKAIEWTWQHIDSGKVVETGCLGGHGRTGTFLACIMAYRGVKPGTACNEVWTRYCKEAIESKSQVELIVKVYEHYHGKKWKQSKTERDIVDILLKPPPKKGATDKYEKCIHGRLMTESCTGCDYQSAH